ncbi:ABC transporter ATP-binding protein [Azospirillum sp.]|uniref:ABC transporter ATP-binding protein n=1 Tax=Azospirillum sp. TaxID=34012 RepID=UPI002D562DFE|nr:ABC transporter ATP-binding protein [Azospirillum sp.]HYD71134.1 ABC transporter ATP-binding protein [Azospirillum sp.]HYH23208.1 ABC transporter ATP-binding protein [Azospirillum sp.]
MNAITTTAPGALGADGGGSPGILVADGLVKQFGGLRAVDGVTLAVQPGEIVGLIGPNGAGKTTVFQMLSGFLSPNAGTVRFRGARIDGRNPAQVCRMGLARTFQIVEVFPSLTVLEVLTMAASVRHTMKAARAVAHEVCTKIGLATKGSLRCSQLTLPDQKALEIGKALATGPQLVLLDEVMAGLRPAETQRVVALIRALRDEGVTFLLVEHIMDVIMNVSDRIVVIAAGKVIAEGLPKAVANDPHVIDVYLGREVDLA